MGVVERLLKRLDDNLNGTIDRHLHSIEIPEQRSVSPDTPWSPFHVAGYWSHCGCCPDACPEIHRDRCDVHQPEDVA